MRNMSNRFKNIRKLIRNNKGGLAIAMLDEVQADISSSMNNLQKLVEIGNKECCDNNNRYFEYHTIQSTSNKLTVNAVSGRFTLKLNKNCSFNVAKELEQMVRNMMSKYDFPPITLRGKIQWVDGEYVWVGSSNSKKFKKTITYKVGDKNE